jgi:hypothetical protein
MKKPSISKLATAFIMMAAASCDQQSLELESVISTTPMDLDAHRNPVPDLRLACRNQPDLIIQSITDMVSVFQPSNTTFPFVVTIKNIGEAAAVIKGPVTPANRVWWQAWQSKNGVTRDRAVCGISFTSDTIDVNQTKTGKKAICRLDGLVAEYPYLIVDLHMYDDSVDCNKSNNTYVMQLLAVSSLP